MDERSALTWLMVILGFAVIVYYGPPDLGCWGLGLMLGVLFVASGFLVLAAQLANKLPEHPQLDQVPGLKPDAEMAGILGQFEALGMLPLGPPISIRITPSVTLVPLHHDASLSYGSVYRVDHGPTRSLGWDFISIFEDPDGVLVTVPRAFHGILPHRPGELIQVFLGATPEEAFRRHLETLLALKKEGLRVKPATAEDHSQYVVDSILHKRRSFLRHPLLGTWTFLWRAVTRSTPHMGPVLDQKVGAREVKDTLARRGLEDR
ncbi:MAG: hypothetical protein AAGN66_03630 [Acidobacteriota bacterium]